MSATSVERTVVFGTRKRVLLVLITLALALQAGSAPAIAAFSASSTLITSGTTVTLNWNITGATSMKIDQNVGTVTGSSIKVAPKVSTTYTLTATNTAGSKIARVTVTVGTKPAITSFSASPSQLTLGKSTTLSWVATGATTLKIDPGPLTVTGTSRTVIPTATTTYTLTATNALGTATSTTTVTVGAAPVIGNFIATPAKLAPGQSTRLTWAVTGSPALMLNPGIGQVTGTSATVTPRATTTYSLTATNPYGTTTATVAVPVGTPPVINTFWTNPRMEAGPGVSTTLVWAATGATTVSIDHGVGTVTSSPVTVSPSSTTTYTMTATNSLGSVTSQVTVNYMPLVQASGNLYYSEHAVFYIPPAGQVTWTGTNSWGSVYSTANVNNYVATLKSLFPDDYFFVAIAANNLTPNSVPSVMDYRHVSDGIGANTITGIGVPNICRYNIGGGTVIDGAFGVLDHEIGHNWGIFVGTEVGNPHWLSNSTATGQMADVYSDDGYATVKQIAGNPAQGFTWSAIDNLTKNESETFSPQDLYLQGLNDTFPDLYVLTSPVYKPDHTMGYASVARYDQNWLVQKNGIRNPTFRTSDKKFRIAVVYVARDLAEVHAVYQPIERSISHFATAEQIDTTTYRFQVPFLVDTQYRASVNALLADLDGNHTPTLSINGSADILSSDGTATIPFTAADADGPAPTVSCVPASANCSISGSNVLLQGLTTGVHFLTIKAQDAGGKKAFAHFVVEVL